MTFWSMLKLPKIAWPNPFKNTNKKKEKSIGS